LRVVGLDFSPDMIDYARDNAVAEGLTIQWLCMDMRSFKLARPVDVVVLAQVSMARLVPALGLVAVRRRDDASPDDGIRSPTHRMPLVYRL